MEGIIGKGYFFKIIFFVYIIDEKKFDVFVMEFELMELNDCILDRRECMFILMVLIICFGFIVVLLIFIYIILFL